MSMAPDRDRATCILTFHRIVTAREVDHDVTWKSYHGLIDELQRSAATFSVALDTEPAGPSVSLTFDDGTVDHMEVGADLARRRIQGVFFIPPGRLGSPGFLDVANVEELISLGHVVGSHSYSHVPLDTVEPVRLAQELRDSKRALEDITGSPVTWFAPPGGISPPGLPAELAGAGYRLSRSMVWGIRRRGADRWRLPCVPVTEFTIRAGWVPRAVRSFRLPISMQLAWRMKGLLPRSSALRLRRTLHRVAATGGRHGSEST
jgi:hypothetical protein